MKHVNVILFPFMILFLFLMTSCIKDETDQGSVVSPDIILTGKWKTNEITIKSNYDIIFTIEFDVLDDNKTIDNISIVKRSTDDTRAINQAIIENGRFSFTKDFDWIICDDVIARLVLSGNFRTESSADGKCKLRNYSPTDEYSFCGETTVNWTAKRISN
jgi:hypothetical protein